MLGGGSFTGKQRKTNQLKQVVGAPKPASSRLRILSQGTSRCARHFFPLPLLLASSARRQTGERSLEDPRNGGRREKPRRRPKRARVATPFEISPHSRQVLTWHQMSAYLPT